MLLANETSVSLKTGLFLTDEKQMLCITDPRLWFITHTIITILIHFFFLIIYLVLSFNCLLCFLLFPWFRSFVRLIKGYISLSAHEQQEQYLYWISFLIKEITFIFVYILLSIFCKWIRFVHNDAPITSMICHRWLIEASSFPYIFFGTYYVYYVEGLDTIFNKNHTMFLQLIMVKIPLFFLMRYAEYQSDFFLNNVETSMINMLCKKLSKKYVVVEI